MIRSKHFEEFVKSVALLKARAEDNNPDKECTEAIRKIDGFLETVGYETGKEALKSVKHNGSNGADIAATAAATASSVRPDYAKLGAEESIWFKLSLLLRSDDPMRVLSRLSEKFGGCVPVKLKDDKIFFLSEPEHFRHVLVENEDKYIKYFDGLIPIFGKSMITIDGALWQKIRKPQQPAFHPNMYAEYLPYFHAAVENRITAWNKIADSGETINLLQETWTLAADMICKALFDRDVPFNPEVVFNAVKTYTDVQNHKTLRLRQNTGSLEEIGATGAAKAIDLWLEAAPTVFGGPSISDREETLMAMLQAAEADPDVPEFDRQQTIDEMKQYLWAGTETTALTLAWAIYILTRHPEIAAKIRAEADEVYGNAHCPDWEQMRDLNYTRSVVQETLRMYPPVWSLIRTACEPDEIAGQKIEPGQKVVLSTYVSHHNPKYWANPEVFDPSRFADRATIKSHVKYSYLPFGLGKRSCIGGAMAITEATMALSQLMKYFEPEYVGIGPASPEATVTLVPKGGGMPFKLHKRVRAQ